MISPDSFNYLTTRRAALVRVDLPPGESLAAARWMR